MVSTFGGDTAKGRTNNLHLQHDVNLKGLRDINAYSLKALPVSQEFSAHRVDSISSYAHTHTTPATATTIATNNSHHTHTHTHNQTHTHTHEHKGFSNAPAPATNAVGAAAGLGGVPDVEIPTAKKAAVQAQMCTHPMVKSLQDTILSSSLTLKNVDLLIEVERLAVMLGGCRITFCKSGKDRTGMASTLEQSRQLGERYGCGLSAQRVLRDANLMRVHGCRLLIAEKNIGRKVYSINKFQAQFLPVMFRPPNQVCEDLLKKDNS